MREYNFTVENFEKDVTKFFEQERFRFDTRTLFMDYINYNVDMILSVTEQAKEEDKKEYEKIVEKYSQEDTQYILDTFKKITQTYAILIEKEIDDYFGHIYQNLGLCNSKGGQVFTPTHIARFMAELQMVENNPNTVEVKPLTVSDPCCGTGSLTLGFLYTAKHKGINYLQDVFLHAQDIDEDLARICFFQLCINGASARVDIGNSLLFEKQRSFYTLGFIMVRALVPDYLDKK